MKKFLQKNYPYLFAIFPLLSLYDYNKDMSTFSYLALPFFISLLGTFCLLNISEKFFKKRSSAKIFSSFFMLSFLSFGHFFAIINDTLHKTSSFSLSDQKIYSFLYYISLSVWIFTVSVIAWALKKKGKKIQKAQPFLAYISLFLVILPLTDITLYNLKKGPSAEEVMKISPQASTTNPDIYYVILDGYGRADVLSELYSFDNSEFINSLEDRGFYVANNSHSNYPQTYLSIASSLNYEYLDSENRSKKRPFTDRGPFKEEVKNASSFELAKEKGYKIVTTPTPWVGVQGNVETDIQFKRGVLNEFEEMLAAFTPLNLYLNDKTLSKKHHKTVLRSFGALKRIPFVSDSTFTISHIYAPHPPFVFDKDGGLHESKGGFWKGDGAHFIKGNPKNPTTQDYKEEYTAQLQFINKKVIEAVDLILENSEVDPVIILQSDHGPGSGLDWEDPEKTNMKERLSILNAYYLPKKGMDMLYPEITPVNSFRVVFNTLFDANLELLDDKSYFARWSKPYEFIDVSERVGER